MKIDEFRQGLVDLASTEPVDIVSARHSVQARADKPRRRWQPPRAVLLALAAAAVVLAVPVVALAQRGGDRIHVTTPVHPVPPLETTTVLPSPTTDPAPPPSVVTPAPTLPPPTTPARVVTLPVDLVFTGRYAGHVTAATLASSGLIVGPHDGRSAPLACTNFWPPDPTGAVIGVQGTLAGRPFIFGYDGAVTDIAQSLSEGWFIIGHDPLTFRDALSFDTAKLVFDSDRLGLRVDSDLYDSQSGSRTVVGHVKGHVRCAP